MKFENRAKTSTTRKAKPSSTAKPQPKRQPKSSHIYPKATSGSVDIIADIPTAEDLPRFSINTTVPPLVSGDKLLILGNKNVLHGSLHSYGFLRQFKSKVEMLVPSIDVLMVPIDLSNLISSDHAAQHFASFAENVLDSFRPTKVIFIFGDELFEALGYSVDAVFGKRRSPAILEDSMIIEDLSHHDPYDEYSEPSATVEDNNHKDEPKKRSLHGIKQEEVDDEDRKEKVQAMFKKSELIRKGVEYFIAHFIQFYQRKEHGVALSILLSGLFVADRYRFDENYMEFAESWMGSLKRMTMHYSPSVSYLDLYSSTHHLIDKLDYEGRQGEIITIDGVHLNQMGHLAVAIDLLNAFFRRRGLKIESLGYEDLVESYKTLLRDAHERRLLHEETKQQISRQSSYEKEL